MTSMHAGPGDPWKAATAACMAGAWRLAAISYVSTGSAGKSGRLPLRRGDLLLVNMSKDALRARATSPHEVDKYFSAGVEVVNSSRLHAKVILTDKSAVIGSANASNRSDKVDEALLVTSLKGIRDQLQNWLEVLKAEGDPITPERLAAAKAIYDASTRRPPPGTGESTGEEQDTTWQFLPGPVGAVWVFSTHEYTSSAAESADIAAAKRAVRRAAGPASLARLDSYRLPAAEADKLSKGDVVILFEDAGDDGVWVWPTEVFDVARKIPYVARDKAVVLRYSADLDDLEMEDVQPALNVQTSSRPLDSYDGKRLSAAQARAVLGCWGLDDRVAAS